ncbi:MAG: hypothetical protein AAF914_02680 [Pseudomonadota bacterium]
MRLPVFIIMSLTAAIAFGAMAFFQGHGIGTIVLRSILVLVAIQVCYAAWLLASAWMTRPGEVMPAKPSKSRDTLTATEKVPQRPLR